MVILCENAFRAFVQKHVPKKQAYSAKFFLSGMTIQRQIQNLAQAVTKQLHERLAVCRYFSLALDESTDIFDTAQLQLVFVRAVGEHCLVTQKMAGLVIQGREFTTYVYMQCCAIFTIVLLADEVCGARKHWRKQMWLSPSKGCAPL